MGDNSSLYAHLCWNMHVKAYALEWGRMKYLRKVQSVSLHNSKCQIRSLLASNYFFRIEAANDCSKWSPVQQQCFCPPSATASWQHGFGSSDLFKSIMTDEVLTAHETSSAARRRDRQLLDCFKSISRLVQLSFCPFISEWSLCHSHSSLFMSAVISLLAAFTLKQADLM